MQIVTEKYTYVMLLMTPRIAHCQETEYTNSLFDIMHSKTISVAESKKVRVQCLAKKLVFFGHSLCK